MTLQEAKTAYEQGETLRPLAQQVGMTVWSLRRALVGMGVQMRSSGRQLSCQQQSENNKERGWLEIAPVLVWRGWGFGRSAEALRMKIAP